MYFTDKSSNFILTVPPPLTLRPLYTQEQREGYQSTGAGLCLPCVSQLMTMFVNIQYQISPRPGCKLCSQLRQAVCTVHHALQRQNTEISKQIFPEKEYRGLSPNFQIHASVSDLNIGIGNVQTDPGTIFLYLRAIFCTFQISVDFYFVPVGAWERRGWRRGGGQREGDRMYTVWVHLVC